MPEQHVTEAAAEVGCQLMSPACTTSPGWAGDMLGDRHLDTAPQTDTQTRAGCCGGAATDSCDRALGSSELMQGVLTAGRGHWGQRRAQTLPGPGTALAGSLHSGLCIH